MATRYWKAGFNAQVDADTAARELRRIKANHGNVLRNADILEEARKKRNPLHSTVFDRSEAAAAEAYYLIRVQTLVRSIEVELEEAPGVRVREFSVIATEKSEAYPTRQVSIYTSTAEAMADPAQRKYVVDQAKEELRRLRVKYAHLKELATVFEAIDKL